MTAGYIMIIWLVEMTAEISVYPHTKMDGGE